MIKKLLLFLFLFVNAEAFAETIRTDVLVIGGTASGTSAAIQAARSKLKTMLVEPGPWLGGSLTSGGIGVLEANKQLTSGIWGEFRKKVAQFYNKAPGYDTTLNATLRFEPYTGAAILKKMTDTVKNLTVKLNTPWTNVKKDGTGWEVSITQNGKSATILAKVLIDATDLADVAVKAGVKLIANESVQNEEVKIPGETLSVNLRKVTWAVVLKDYGKAANQTITKPENYNRDLYACLKSKNIMKLLAEGKLPNEKYLINWEDCGNAYPATVEDLNPEKREAFFKMLRLRTIGLVYYLQTELGFKNLSPDDEFGTPDHLPYTPYIREYKHAPGLVRMIGDDIVKPYNRESKLYRTGIAVGDAFPEQSNPAIMPFPAYSVALGTLVVKGFDNLIVTGNALSVTGDVSASTCNPAVQMVIGQGAGTIAAFCAFFKTTTSHLNVRAIQGELLDYKGYLLPISDIPQADPNFRAIQQVAATGMLKTRTEVVGNQVKILFKPDSIVQTAEIKPVINEIYTRGFLWFNKAKPAENFTVGNLLSFISEITLSEPKPLQIELQKQWKTVYKFTGSFDLNRPVTRREFAVLANNYLNPFARQVDITGKLIN
ncbi:FAD-dependent oxidoreductase [Mucilaginibacter sp. KACC 22063]|uniref:FAD-dependent oxidoreductase n=1 Tax=Mucilaginibacter sp. KACC 22063 TaxID=3025666 RepID=UPI002365E937|nr:FAD-dependent oxidoreductase [Mucilaginibacter sp. KACC 22063]WDF55356.1 FAD-dependent oxidoreductase [Mucilaginibacter sp. KACC 22063]